VPVAQRVEDADSQHNALVGLQCQFSGGMDGLPIVRQAEWFHAQICPQFKQMLAPGFLPLCILRPARCVDAQLSSDPLQQRHWHGGVG
jgi:hypothetical protein